MTRFEAAEDSPRQTRGNGDGQDSSPYPCTIHAAQLVENRQLLVETRDAIKALCRRIDDESATRVRWAGDIEFGLLEQTAAIKNLTAIVGTPPDQSTGTPGSGMRAQLAAAVNHATRVGVRQFAPSIVDEEESEVTGTYDRETLIAVKRLAERKLLTSEDSRRKAMIAAYASGLVLVIGAIAAALTQIIPLLR